MSQACIKALNLHASEVLPVKVEVDISPGIPQISIVGMADQAIREASLRVRTALKASGYQIPRAKILVNLSPSGMRKSGSGFDLAIALGILQASGQIFLAAVKDSVFVGELSLEGQIHPVKGMVAY
ncbi:MAG: magnesium chelatase domain-containing protein [Coriobacteriia bacterium]|nr:magnesium chelatase domain-containing protein [Coriobacteriia bacterium]